MADRRTVSMLCLVMIVASLIVVPHTAHSANRRPRAFVTMISEPSEWVGQGGYRYFSSSNASVTGEYHKPVLGVGVSGGNLGDGYGFNFSPAEGQPLRIGLYADAQRLPFNDPGHPGMDVSGSGRGCNEVEGSFDIKDIVRSGTEVKRLWMTYDHRCEGGSSLYGEVRIGMTDLTGVVAGPLQLEMPERSLFAAPVVAPVTIENNTDDAITIDGVAIAGPGASSFDVRRNECQGLFLAPGDGCFIFLRFRPNSAGPRLATATIADSSGETHRIAVNAYTVPGRSRLYADSEEGDYIGLGERWRFDQDEAAIGGYGTPQQVAGAVFPYDNRDEWDFGFLAPSGDVLEEGRTYTTGAGGASFGFSAGSRGCTARGQFTIDDIAFDKFDQVRHFAIRFEQRCDTSDARLTGTVEFRRPVGDTQPPSPVSSIDVERDGRTVEVSWSDPPDPDHSFTIVRYVRGNRAPTRFSSGIAGYAGSGTSTTFKSRASSPFSVAVFSVDAAGNVSEKATATAPAVGP